MRILLQPLADPTDQIVQNEMTDFRVYNCDVLAESAMVAGGNVPSRMYEIPIPSAMVGLHEWYGLLPRKLGPKGYAGGEIVFLDVGDTKTREVVDAGISWLNQNLGKQIDGYTELHSGIVGPLEPTNTLVIAAEDPLDDTEKIELPRKAIVMTGMTGKRVFPRLPESYFLNEMANGTMVQSTQMFRFTGQTLDSTGAALGGCRVVLLATNRMAVGAPDVVIAETISDGGGNYSIIAPLPVPSYQLIAYLPGSPDVAGITRNDVSPERI
jgi:hypothetical protein